MTEEEEGKTAIEEWKYHLMVAHEPQKTQDIRNARERGKMIIDLITEESGKGEGYKYYCEGLNSGKWADYPEFYSYHKKKYPLDKTTAAPQKVFSKLKTVEEYERLKSPVRKEWDRLRALGIDISFAEVKERLKKDDDKNAHSE